MPNPKRKNTSKRCKKKERKQSTCVVQPLAQTQLLEKANSMMLTPLVKRKAKTLKSDQKYFFNIWAKSKEVEFLPEGIPYKISSDPEVKYFIGVVIPFLNKPLILVASYLNKAERANMARHELIEWTYFRPRGKVNEAHQAHHMAIERTNPRLYASACSKYDDSFSKHELFSARRFQGQVRKSKK